MIYLSVALALTAIAIACLAFAGARANKRAIDSIDSKLGYRDRFFNRDLTEIQEAAGFADSKVNALYVALDYTYEPSKTVGPRAVRKLEEPTI